MTFRVTAFPAGDGDCFLLSYGGEGKLSHVLVDGGRGSTYDHLRPALVAIATAGETLELLVLTHIDADHIAGSLNYLRDPAMPVVPGRVWYNGYDQLQQLEAFSYRQADEFSERLAELGWPVNADFPHNTAVVEAAPTQFEIAGLKITLLSPDVAHLRTLRARWAEWRTAEAARAAAKKGKAAEGYQAMGGRPLPVAIDVDALAGPSPMDSEPPNGSSIAFLAEYDGRRVLLAGDAHPDLLAQTIAPLAAAEEGRLRVELLKLSHHGSRGNTTRELVELLDCRRFLISTNGTIHGHPDPEAIARILKFGEKGTKTLLFNYAKKRTLIWDDADLKADHDYVTEFAGADLPFPIDI